VEALEEVCLLLARDAGAVVGDGDDQFAVPALQRDLDVPTLGGELVGVGQQVGQRLLNAAAVHIGQRWPIRQRGLQLLSFLLHQRRDGRDRALHDAPQVGGLSPG